MPLVRVLIYYSLTAITVLITKQRFNTTTVFMAATNLSNENKKITNS